MTAPADASLYDEHGRQVSGPGEHHTGQVRIAYRLAGTHRDQLLHVHGIGWHHYDGRHWTPDHNGHARRAVLDTLTNALTESANDKQLRADVARCESDAGINGVLGIAASLIEYAATVHDLDADPHLLNCANGTLDLRDRTLHPHNPVDRLTKITAGAYSPDADMTVWEAFLASVLPDPAERDYLRRVIGQAVHGTVREHLFPVLIGTGANGKGTTYGAVNHALGGYATVINPALLMSHDPGRAGGPEMMTLLGARLVIGSETEDGRKLDEATMKRLTGGDELTARHLYREPVTWKPSHQLIYVTNALPSVKGDDPAVWRRIRVIPFDVVVPPEQRDLDLPDRLTLHADAILTWAVAGYFDYEDNGGMREPATVLRATSAYQSNSDAVARFVRDECIVGPGMVASIAELWERWCTWRAEDGAAEVSKRVFGDSLDRRGYPVHRGAKGGRIRRGIALQSNDDSDDPGGWRGY
ncbi:MAG: phage/plasmid primase, P4 family [Candidatus Dormibacteraeota bacterium]|nr:phage/plasmid primase, P4 family [Candidatus Dormibacteraeota bacterium]